MDTPPSSVPHLRRSILYVGDSAPQFLVAAAAPCAWTATHAQNGALAAAALTEGQFSICLIDLTQPDTEGTTLAHLFLQSRPDLLLVLLTSYATSRAAEAILAAGATDLWQVPVIHQEGVRRLRLYIQLVERRYECDALRYRLANISETMPPLDGLTGVDLNIRTDGLFRCTPRPVEHGQARGSVCLFYAAGRAIRGADGGSSAAGGNVEKGAWRLLHAVPADRVHGYAHANPGGSICR